MYRQTRLLGMVSCLLLSLAAEATIKVDPAWAWFTEIKKQEPEITNVIHGWIAFSPEPKKGQKISDFRKLLREAREEYPDTIEPETRALVIEKLESAYRSEPRNWKLVYLAVAAAQYLPPDPRVLEIAAQIIVDIPSTGLGTDADQGLLTGAMMCLGRSGQGQYAQRLLYSLSERYAGFVDERGLNPKHTARSAIIALGSFGPMEARLSLLEEARLRVAGIGNSNYLQDVIDKLLQSMDETDTGAVFEEILAP